MEMTLRKPYRISWLAMPVLTLMGLLFRQHTLDIQLHDTYFVVDNIHFALAGSAFLLVVGLGYWLVCMTEKTPNIALSIMHLLPTIGMFMLLALPISGRGDLVSTEWLLLGVAMFLIGQGAYVVNILLTLVRK